MNVERCSLATRHSHPALELGADLAASQWVVGSPFSCKHSSRQQYIPIDVFDKAG